MENLTKWTENIDSLQAIFLAAAGLLVLLVCASKFEELTEPETWDPPPSFLTSKMRYVGWKWFYAFFGVGTYLIMYAALNPLSEVEALAIDAAFLNGPLAPFVAAFMITGLAFDLPKVREIESWVRKRVHAWALIPERSRQIVADLNASPLVGEPVRDGSENGDSTQCTHCAQMREFMVGHFNHLGIHESDFDAPQGSFVGRRLRVIHLYYTLANELSGKQPYAAFFTRAERQWDLVQEGYRDLEGQLKVYDLVPEQEKANIEENTRKFLQRLSQFISYMIIFVQGYHRCSPENALQALGLRPQFARSQDLSYNAVAIFALIGIVVLVFEMVAFAGIMYSLEMFGGAGIFDQAAIVGIFYYLLALGAMAATFVIRKHGLQHQWWKLPSVTGDESTFVAKYISGRVWGYYVLCVVVALWVGFGVLALRGYITGKNVEEMTMFLPMLMLPAVTAFFVAHYIDSCHINTPFWRVVLAQGIVTSVVTLVAVSIVFAERVPQKLLLAVAGNGAVIGLIIGFLVGLLGFAMAKEELAEGRR